MAARNLNYFGTFLDTMNAHFRTRQAGAAQVRTSFAGSVPAWQPSPASPLPAEPDPLNEILKALDQRGDLGAKELVPLTNLSLTKFLEAAGKLATLGVVEVSAACILHLTAKGQELAAVLRDKSPSQADGER